MGFLFNPIKKEQAQQKRAPARPKDIPIQSLNRMGCSVCPRDKDQSIMTPKMEADGSDSPLVYLLGSAPSLEEDEKGRRWVDAAGRAVTRQFGDKVMRNDVRSSGVTQCLGADEGEHGQVRVDAVEVECCRGRIVADIERTRPLVLVTVGEEALRWATGQGSAMVNRGTWIAAKIGKHSCWVYPLLYPNFVHKNSYSKSEYELALEHDVDALMHKLDRELVKPPKVYDKPYDQGITQITGQEPGDFQRLEEAFHRLMQLKKGGLDLETNAISPYIRDPQILTAAIGNFKDTVAFSIDHPMGWGSEAQMKRVRGAFGEFLLYSGKKVAHNLSFEMQWLGFLYGWKLLRMTEWEDTMGMCHTLDEREGTKSLDYQTLINFGFNLKAQSKVDVRIDKWWLKFPLPQILRYNGMDTKWTDLLEDHLHPVILASDVLNEEYERKLRMTPTLVMITDKGFPTDLDYAQKLSDANQKKLGVLEAKIRRTPEVEEYTRRFGSFSPTNANHVLALLKTVLKRPEVRVEKRGESKDTTGEAVLSILPVDEVPSAPLIVEHREITRNESNYILPVLEGKLISHDKRLHPSYSSMVAVTGRLSSEAHNWPKRKHKEVRGIVSTEHLPGKVWICPCDYGQIEFRVAGMLSEDKNLVKYCWTSYDVHKYWAQRIVDEYGEIKDYIVEAFQVDWDEKGLKTLRQEAKNGWVFPQIFGSSVRSCAEQLHVPLDIMEDLAEEFWDEFAGVKRWQEKVLTSYARNLYVETLGGRRRRGPMTRNEAINMGIQGTALDIVTAAMDRLSEISLEEDDDEYQCNFNGHDDLTFLLQDQTMEQKLNRIVLEMCRPRFDYINVPLVVEVSCGTRWHDVKGIGVYRSDILFGTPNPYK